MATIWSYDAAAHTLSATFPCHAGFVYELVSNDPNSAFATATAVGTSLTLVATGVASAPSGDYFDAYIDEASPDSNYIDSNVFKIGTSSAGERLDATWNFDGDDEFSVEFAAPDIGHDYQAIVQYISGGGFQQDGGPTIVGTSDTTCTVTATLPIDPRTGVRLVLEDVTDFRVHAVRMFIGGVSTHGAPGNPSSPLAPTPLVHLTAAEAGSTGVGASLGYDLGGTLDSVYVRFELYWPKAATKVWENFPGPQVFLSSPTSDPVDWWRGVRLAAPESEAIPSLDSNSSFSKWWGHHLADDEWHVIEWWQDGAAISLNRGWWKVDGVGGLWVADSQLVNLDWLFFGPTYFNGGDAVPSDWWIRRVQIGTAPGLSDILDFDAAVDNYATTFTPYVPGASTIAPGNPPNVARFIAAGDDAYAEKSLPASSSYTFKVRARISLESLALLGTDSSAIVRIGTHATANDILFVTHDYGKWQYWTNPAPLPAGSFDASVPVEIVCELTYDSGTLWDFVWKADGVTLITDTGVDLGIDDTSPLDLFQVGGAGGGPNLGEVYEILTVEVRDHVGTVIFTDDFASGDFSAWDSTYGAATVDQPTVRPAPAAASGSVRLKTRGLDSGPRIAQFNFDVADAWVEKLLPVSSTYVVTVHGLFSPDTVGALGNFADPDIVEFDNSGDSGMYPLTDGWNLYGMGSVRGGGVPLPGVPFEAVFTLVWNAGGATWDISAVVDGVPVGSTSSPLDHDDTVGLNLVLGARFTGWNAGWWVGYTDITVTDGTSTIFSDDFSSLGFSNWDSVHGDAVVANAGIRRHLGLAYEFDQLDSVYARVEMLFPSATLAPLAHKATLLAFNDVPGFVADSSSTAFAGLDTVVAPDAPVWNYDGANTVVVTIPATIGDTYQARCPQSGSFQNQTATGSTVTLTVDVSAGGFSPGEGFTIYVRHVSGTVYGITINNFAYGTASTTGTSLAVAWAWDDINTVTATFDAPSGDNYRLIAYYAQGGSASSLLGPNVAGGAGITCHVTFSTFDVVPFLIELVDDDSANEDSIAVRLFAPGTPGPGVGGIPSKIVWTTDTPGGVAAFDGSGGDSYVQKVLSPQTRYRIKTAVELPTTTWGAFFGLGSPTGAPIIVGDPVGVEADIYANPSAGWWSTGEPQVLAKFDVSAGSRYVTKTFPASGGGTSYGIRARVMIPALTLANLFGVPTDSAWLFKVGSSGTYDQLRAFRAFSGWGWQGYQGGAVPTPNVVAGRLHIVEAIIVHNSGTTWDITWRVNGVPLFTNTAVDLGVDMTGPFSFSLGGIDPYGVANEDYYVESVVVFDDTDAVVFEDKFYSRDFSAWDSVTGPGSDSFWDGAATPPLPGPVANEFDEIELILEHDIGHTWLASWLINGQRLALADRQSVYLPNTDGDALVLTIGNAFTLGGVTPQTFLVRSVVVYDATDTVMFEEHWLTDFSAWDTRVGSMEILGGDPIAAPTPNVWHTLELWYQRLGASYFKVDGELVAAYAAGYGLVGGVSVGAWSMPLESLEFWINRFQIGTTELGSDLVAYDPAVPNVVADTFVVGERISGDSVEIGDPPVPPPGPRSDIPVADTGATVSDSISLRHVTRHLADAGASISDVLTLVPHRPVAMFDGSGGNTYIEKKVGPTSIYKFQFDLGIPATTFSNIMDGAGGEFLPDLFMVYNPDLGGDVDGLYFTMDFDPYNIWRAITEDGRVPLDQFGTKFIPNVWCPVAVVATWSSGTLWRMAYTFNGATFTNADLTDLQVTPADMMTFGLGVVRGAFFATNERYYIRNVVVKDGAAGDAVIFSDDFGLGVFEAKGWTQKTGGFGALDPVIVSDPFPPLPGINRTLADTGATVSSSISTLRHVTRYLSDTGAAVSDTVFATPSIYYPTPSGAAHDLLGDLQPELQGVGDVRMPLLALSYELARVEQSGYSLLNRMFPAQADDVLGTLPLWEELLALPIRPTGVSLESRVRAVKAAAKARHVPSNHGWVDLITEILGSSSWSFTESSGTVTVHIFGGGTEYSIGQVTQIIRRVTPAHLAVAVI